MSDKLGSDKELRRRYGLMILGLFDDAGRKGLFSFVDRFLDRMEGTAGRKMDKETVCSVVAANVMNYAGDAKQLLLVTSAPDLDLEAVRSDIAPALTGSFRDKQEEILTARLTPSERLRPCEAVILVEEAEKLPPSPALTAGA